MLCTAHSESPADPAPREDYNDDLVLEEDGSSRQNDQEENQIAVPEKFADIYYSVIVAVSERPSVIGLTRVRIASKQDGNLGQKVRAKRQRILISSAYENRIEHISDKIDDLSKMMRRLSHECWSNNGFAAPIGLGPPSNPPLQSSQSRVAGRDNRPAATNRRQPFDEVQGIESTLFAHVIFATRFLQGAVADDPQSNVAAEMISALDALRSTVNVQKQKNETVEDSPPFSKPIPPGFNHRDLPIPSMDRILACLRVAQERLPTQFYWPFEFGSLGDFTQYVVKACSPGPVTDMELIIVHYGLNCLFTGCATATVDDIAKQDHEAQALICRNSLEMILSNLSFHITTNKDSVCAMYMATIYCLQQGKPFAAWAFISKASLMSQALGMHISHAMLYETAEETDRKIRLFWAIYTVEKEISLRLGRSSTIRDHDITLPRLILDRKMTSLIYHRLPDWIDVASLYGRVYDNIYSPNALAQPISIRASHARSLATEFEGIMAMRAELYKRPSQWTSHVINPTLCRFIIHAYRATDYSILACIYRGVPSGQSSRLAFYLECISSARLAINEVELCITMLGELGDMDLQSPSLDRWTSEIIFLAPFMPFLILFCNVIETSDLGDLDHLQRLVDGLQSMARSKRYSACSKQLQILSPLCNVANKFVETKARRKSGGLMSGHFTDLDINKYLDSNDFWFGIESCPSPIFAAPEHCPASDAQRPVAAFPTEGTGDQGHQVVNPPFGLQPRANTLGLQYQLPEYSMELDAPGSQLESWLH
ncbi:Transcription factor [Penicillium cf. griseofulvum]|uniref:Transcription factor n=1 Tax=Penicillium cf. griseofulvum TaxID=2972120 RepID=A0A9W9M266_9EURO|nr:Transcription factor [Penicillium cf. griseofulvum]KAJ5429224.1 Transcription factor [Penicillium cf. griseofulvum]KAJ5436984.1 Transcription factor [Penicillium cf. griseofulvum]